MLHVPLAGNGVRVKIGSSGDTIPNSMKISNHRQSRWYEEDPLNGPVFSV